MRTIFYLLMCVSCLFSCKNEQKAPPVATPAADSTGQVAPQVVYDRATFLSKTVMDSMDTPRTVVSFAFGKNVEKIDTSVTGTFNLLEPEEMKQMKLPKSCIVAGKAFWAGLQVVFVIDSTAKGYVVKRQYEDEGSTGKEPFEVIKTFPK
ncbi:MAG: hypothetical protein JNL70_03810 [Saprospiraceae bacterium]|nr:hypothetical protein [Saprospiraceae bacterium]